MEQRASKPEKTGDLEKGLQAVAGKLQVLRTS